MAWAHQDCDRTLRLGEQRKDFSRRMKEKLREKEKLKRKAEDAAKTRGAELKGARAELKAAQNELSELKES